MAQHTNPPPGRETWVAILASIVFAIVCGVYAFISTQ